jgi:actin-like ATPase involved in cell morphogenesis
VTVGDLFHLTPQESGIIPQAESHAAIGKDLVKHRVRNQSSTSPKVILAGDPSDIFLCQESGPPL